MTSEEARRRMIEYLRGELAPRQERELEDWLDGRVEERREFEELRETWKLMDFNPDVRLPAEVSAAIERSLESEYGRKSEGRTDRVPGWMKWAAGLVIVLLISWWVVRAGLDKPSLDANRGDIQLVSTDNAGSRVQAIHAVRGRLDSPAVRRQLLRLLNEDENENVRLLALSVLSEYRDGKELRGDLIASIGRQHSPQVQLALAHMAGEWDDPRAVPALQQVAGRTGTQAYVREVIQKTLEELQ